MTARGIVLGVIVTTAGAAIAYGVRRGRDTPVGSGTLWNWVAEAQHETSRVPSMATRMSDADEIRIGDRIAGDLIGRWPSTNADVEFSRTVDEVGQRVAAGARRRLPYRFHYVADPGFFNAFALPGGHVAIGKALARALETEDQLAAILGHEIAHVDRYHCAERVQFQAASRGLPLGELLMVPITLFQAGYTKDEELEADRHGTVLAVEAGYSAFGAVNAMRMLANRDRRVARRATDPLAESGRAGLEGLSEYLKSHPDPEGRIAAIEALIRAEDWLPQPERPLRRTP